MITLMIVRHGLTDWNKEKRLMGHQDIDLSEEGIKQAEKIAKRLKDEKIDYIYSSDLKRTIDTATIINKHHNLMIIVDNNLKEIGYGDFEGKSKEEIQDNSIHKKLWNERKKDIYAFRLPGAENFTDVLDRVKTVLKKILTYHDKTILIVCHGVTKRALVQIIKKLSNKETHKQYFNLTAISIFHIDEEKVKTKIYNCIKHLD